MSRRWPQVKRLGDAAALRARIDELGIDLPLTAVSDGGGVDPGDGGVPIDPVTLRRPMAMGRLTVPNRLCVLPMEGWDAAPDGRPTDLVARRWARFGASGAGLVWGGEAVAVRDDGRANPNQLRIGPDTADDLAALRRHLLDAHRSAFGADAVAPVVGLQLTHAGRYARPDGRPRPRTVFRHPVLDERVGAGDAAVLDDAELDELADDVVSAAVLAAGAGYDFVDIKACHGYLGHELLGAVDRPGRYGGPLERRARFLLGIIERVRDAAPGLGLGVRLSVFDLCPFRPGADGAGVPDLPAPDGPYRCSFGGDGSGLGTDLTEPLALVDALADAGVAALCVTAGSPYYNPHIQRPAYFPPSDGYDPPEDPLVGVARLLGAARTVKAHRPDLVVVASGVSYLQEWLPAVAESVVRDGWADSVGLGRMMLSYPTLPADVLAGRRLDTRSICRTFSDCTTAPRHGLVSGCYPLDPFYKDRPERVELAAVKRRRARRA